MATSRIALAVLLLTGIAKLTEAGGFLKIRPEQVSKEDVQQFLLAELAGRKDGSTVRDIETYMAPLFASLPKNALGRLDAPLVRYSLHRYFVQRHGWHVKGFDAPGSHNETSSPATVLKARAPVYIQGLFEQHLHGRGFGLHELAVFAATLADLIHAEAIGQLEMIHQLVDLSTSGPISKFDAEFAIQDFLVVYLLGSSSRAPESYGDLEQMRKRVPRQYPDYPESVMWMEDFRRTYDLAQVDRRNPFIERAPTFSDSVAFILEFSHHFGAFQSLECHTVKRKLVDSEHMGTGRVRLADFYSVALAGGWEFMESVEYLRNQGALDETDPERPSVVIPNYMNSPLMCLTASNFYSLCCVNECNALMATLEKAITVPQATPHRIAQIVSGMPSDTVDAPRNLSSTLLARLDDIAHYHGGSVPLHGRLFAQWMHHAFPRECQFPHITGSVNPLTPEEFARKQGVHALEATKDEMQAYASWKNETSIVQSLPWAHVEEVFAVHTNKTGASHYSCLSILAAMVALASFAAPMLRIVRDVLSDGPELKPQGHMV